MKFTMGNTQYTTNEKGNRFYKIEDGKKTRISEVEFNEAFEALGHKVVEDAEIEAVIDEYGCVDCTCCDKQNCVHRDCMRRNPKEIGGLALCPRLHLESKAEEPKKEEKPKKKRRPKDIAFEMKVKDETVVTLTAKQVDFLHHVPDTCFFEGAESGVWVDCLCDEIGGQFAGKPMTVGAMVSTLREKNIVTVGVERVNGHKAKFFEFTDLGKTVLRDLDIIREV